jgi:hypothetical protein
LLLLLCCCRTGKFIQGGTFDWLQFTFCITSQQRFAAYTQKGGQRKDEPVQYILLAGDPDKVLDVTEYVVFERKTREKVRKAPAGLAATQILSDTASLEGSRWRLVGWLQP